MEIKIVKAPFQDKTTLIRDKNYPGESWCVKTSMYRECDGGMSLWLKEIERAQPDTIYSVRYQFLKN